MELAKTCPFLVTPETNQKYNKIQFDPGTLPSMGVCMANKKICEWLLNMDNCKRRRNEDLCDVSELWS